MKPVRLDIGNTVTNHVILSGDAVRCYMLMIHTPLTEKEISVLASLNDIKHAISTETLS